MLSLLVGYSWHKAACGALTEGFPHPQLAMVWIWLLRTIVPAVLAVVLWFKIGPVLDAARALISGGG